MDNTTKGKFDIVVLQGSVITGTHKATLIDFAGEEVWIPNSQFKKPSIQDEPESEPSLYTIFIPRWLAEQRELDYMEDESEVGGE